MKQADLAIHGQPLQGNTNTNVIGIINCTDNNEKVVQNLTCGIRQANGFALNFNVANYNDLQRLAPATAKYAYNYHNAVATQVAGLIRTQMLDGVIAIVDNYVMGLAVLYGCTKTNCPVLIMPTGINNNYDTCLLNAAGKIATREIKAGELEKVAEGYTHQNGTPLTDTLTLDFFRMAEAFELAVAGTTNLQANACGTLNLALNASNTIMQMASDIITTKRLISKRTVNEKLEQYKNNGGSVAGLLMFQKIFEAVDLKVNMNQYPSLKTTLADQAFVVSDAAAPMTMEGQAWVYSTIADAVTALASNAIDSGIVVVQACTACDVSIVAHTIQAMGKADSIALMTDGFCAATPVLTVAHMSPDGYANQDFANIQDGDSIEIDVTKGRININVNSKDMKVRAKRNVLKKREMYF